MKPPIAVCWGAGVDSTGMLVEMHRRGIRPDIITFADVGAEKTGTYEFIPIFSQWLRDVGFPEPTICTYEPQAKTSARYRAAVIEAADRLGLALTEIEIVRLSRIFGNSIANETLPGIAFGMKSCSVKWKLEAQEPVRIRETALRRAWESGLKVRKFIGFDATEDHRTFADGKGMQIAQAAGLPAYGDRYDVEYPLRTWGLDRDALCRIIAAAGLPIPPKSACFFCPSMKWLEVEQLRRESPKLHALAMELERVYREGRHFRGDNVWTVRGKHKRTGELIEQEVTAADAAGARAIVRAVLKDTARPYHWDLDPSAAVPGLGRSFSWIRRESEESVSI